MVVASKEEIRTTAFMVDMGAVPSGNSVIGTKPVRRRLRSARPTREKLR